jgi:hypothetical protein
LESSPKKSKNNKFLPNVNISFNLNKVIGVIHNPFLKNSETKNQTSDSLVRLEVLKRSVDIYSQQAKQKLVLKPKPKNLNNLTSVCNTLESQNITERNQKIKENISKDKIFSRKIINNIISTVANNL